jgi:hypothetical protein
MTAVAKIRALAIASFVGWAGLNDARAAMVCTRMKHGPPGPTYLNSKLAGPWKMALHSVVPLVCSFQLNNDGVIQGTGTCAGSPAFSGTIAGAIVVSANCKVTGSFQLVVTGANINNTYTIDAAIHQSGQSGNTSASIVMGEAFDPPHNYHIFFWMIQTP